MTWILFAVLTAVARSLTDVAGKKGVKKLTPFTVAWGMYLFSLPILGVAVFSSPFPTLNNNFWWALTAGTVLNIVANILYLRAIQLSDLSLTVPLVTFTPLFMLLTSPLIVGEFPSPYGILGIICIVTGAYLLNLNRQQQNIWSPFRALFQEKGARLMLLVAFIWSLSSNFDKMGIINSSALSWAFCINVSITIGLTPLMLVREKKPLKQLARYPRQLIWVGLFNGATILFQMLAASMTLVAYVIAIKRSSAVISVIFGKIFFHEKGVKNRLIGVLIMLAGVIIITLTAL